MADLISRQAVIKAITDNADKICDCMYSDGTVKDDVVAVVLDLIDTVPEIPLKIGDTAWAIRTYKGVKYAQKGFVNEMFYNKDMKLVIVVKNIARGLFGEKVFATKEDAEQALKQMGE